MAKHILLAFLAMLPLTVSHGTNLLFLGPGGYSGKSEVFSPHEQCGNVTRAFCRVPDYPVTDIEAYVAFVMEGYPQLCGGYSGSTRESCYSLRDSAWVTATPMRSPRNHAAAATLNNGSVLVSGGEVTTGDPPVLFLYSLSSSEMLTGSTWSPALELPSARYAHCMIYLSTEEVFLHGGWTLSGDGRDTYLSTDLKKWETKSTSLKTRVYHACAEVTLNTEQEVWVGSKGTTEIYSVATDTWRTGPALPSSTKYPGEFISHNDQLYLAASYDNKNVYQLKAGWTLEDAWQKVGETSSSRFYFQALMISQDTCEGCARTNKQTFLRSLNVVKKVKTSSECQTRCAEYSGCTHFEWKKTKNVDKRTCTLQKVGYKKKKNFVSGPISC